MRTVDVHAHMSTPEADLLLRERPEFGAQFAQEALALGEASSRFNQTQFAQLGPRLAEIGLRLEAMDAAGIDVQTVSAAPIARPWMDVDLAREYYTAANRAVIDHCALAPDRLVPIAAVALHIPELAIKQLREAVKNGAVGVQISTSAAPGVELDHPSLRPFWQATVDLDIPVLIHPWGCTLGERLDVGYMFNHVGNPTETAVALSRLIFGGVFDRFPDLRVWAAHGGGWLPSYSGRADHAWQAREDARTCEHPPSWYLRRVWVDALVYSTPALRFLVDSVGADHVTIGTDYPFDMGVTDPLVRINVALPDPAERSDVRTHSAYTLFGPRLADRLPMEQA